MRLTTDSARYQEGYRSRCDLCYLLYKVKLIKGKPHVKVWFANTVIAPVRSVTVIHGSVKLLVGDSSNHGVLPILSIRAHFIRCTQ